MDMDTQVSERGVKMRKEKFVYEKHSGYKGNELVNQ
jgi:hypothetical protein